MKSFVKEIIEEWRILSPTIIVQNDMPEMCMTFQWALCLANDMGMDELAPHLATIHQHRKQDGIIFIAGQGHRDLIKELVDRVPSLFTSNSPVFMPADYSKDISLRLDSNIIFYEIEMQGTYRLLDKFAVKGGPMIVLALGYWNVDEGINLQASMNRWDRRTDLKGATFRNCLLENGHLTYFIKDESGNISGSKGYFQDIAFDC